MTDAFPTLQTFAFTPSPDGATLNLGGGPQFTPTERQYEDFADRVLNAYTSRIQWMQQRLDPRRDVKKECGYPDNGLNPEQYYRMYREDPIAGAVVERYPEETYKVAGEVWEDDDSETKTAFEEAWDGIGKQLSGDESYYDEEYGSLFWAKMLEWDIHSRAGGGYGLLLIGLDDGLKLSEPARGVVEENSSEDGYEYTYSDGGYKLNPKSKFTTNAARRNRRYSITRNADPRKLLYLRTFPEAQARPTRWQRNPFSPRFGMPTMYQVDFADPTNNRWSAPSDTKDVHWTRVVPLKADGGVVSSPADGISPLETCLWPLLDLQKMYGATGEGYFRSGLPLYMGETPPAVAGASFKVDYAGQKDMWENMMNSLQRWGVSKNLVWKILAPSMVDPDSFVNVQLERIAIRLRMPVRKLKGSERGELASGQDDGDWNDVVRGRQEKRAIPYQLVPVVNRFILLGLLPEPESGKFKCGWPEPDELSSLEKATVMLQRAQAFSAALSGGVVPQMFSPTDYLVREADYNEDEAKQIEQSAAQATQDQQDMQLEQQQAQIDAGVIPDPNAPPPPPNPVTVKPGDKLIEHPSQAKPGMRPKTLAQGNPLPKKSPTSKAKVRVKNQNRDELGRFATEASAKADASGTKEDHKAAWLAHSKAADAYKKAGDEDKMGHHLNKSYEHRAKAIEEPKPYGPNKSRVNWRGK